jgi:hypothetical protein
MPIAASSPPPPVPPAAHGAPNLSTQVEGKRGVSPRDPIGPGPYYNANGELIASNLDQLHIMPNISARTAVDEKGNRVKDRGDKPNESMTC